MIRPALGMVALTASVLVLSACAGDNGSPASDSTTSTTTSATTSVRTSTTLPKTTQGAAASATVEETAEPTAADEQAEVAVPETPAQEAAGAPTATCATDYTLYQPGTTFYSDGTSGYSAECQAQMESLMAQSGQFPDYSYNNLPDPEYPDYIVGRDPSGAAIKAPEVEADAIAGQDWWGDCMATNDAATCQANDPWQQ